MQHMSLKLEPYHHIIDSYWYYADLLYLIQDVDKEKLWLINHYTRLIGVDLEYKISIHFDFITDYKQYMVSYYDCPFIEFFKINKKDILMNDFLKFVKEQIKQGYCILLLVDRECFENKNFLGRGYHQIMIYGYDDKAQRVYYCDNALGGKYQTDLYCSFDELVQAYQMAKHRESTQDGFDDSIFLLKPTRCEGYELELDSIKRDLDDYLNINQVVPMRYPPFFKEKFINGIHIYQRYIDILDNILNETIEMAFEMRDIHNLWDHKKTMLVRLNYLHQNNYIDDSRLVKDYQAVEQGLLNFRNLFLRYHITKNNQTLIRMSDILKRVNETEYNVLSEFLRIL